MAARMRWYVPHRHRIAFHEGLDLRVGGVGTRGEQRGRLHDLPALAVAALRHLVLLPGRLQRMFATGRGEPLDGRDLLAGHADTAVEQARMGRPSMCTVQAPHSPIPHEYFVPVSLSVSRRTHRSGVWGSPSNVRASPLTENRTEPAGVVDCGMAQCSSTIRARDRVPGTDPSPTLTPTRRISVGVPAFGVQRSAFVAASGLGRQASGVRR